MYKDDRVFEQEVIRIARLVWPSASAGGAVIEDGRERDGVFVTDECVHILECTVSTRKDKAQQDTSKISSLVTQMRQKHPTKAVKGWFITQEEPTADQRTTVNKFGNGVVVAVSFGQFSAQLVDAHTYFSCRDSFYFGSAKNPDSDETEGRKVFIPPEIAAQNGDPWAVSAISSALGAGKKFVLLGDFGAGKSTVVRELFTELSALYKKKKLSAFPIALNLRDHQGQTNPAEALERHARAIGFPSPHHLVRAWRAAQVILLLDGFDEIATTAGVGQLKASKDVRFRFTQLIREFVTQAPKNAGLLVSGRLHFFFNEKERRSALALSDECTFLTIADFSDEQVKNYLKKKGWNGAIPEWLPTRPLLLAILASRGLLQQLADETQGLSPAEGWDELLSRISNREALLGVGVDGETVRILIERLATKARRTPEGLGPLQIDDLANAFYEICGRVPDEHGLMLLQRLPGLGVHVQEERRVFLDRDFVEAAKAGDVVRFLTDPFTYKVEDPSDWRTTLRPLGREVAAHKCRNLALTVKQLNAAIPKAMSVSHFLATDLLLTNEELGFSYDGPRLALQDVDIHDASFGDTDDDFSRLTFCDCVFHRIELSAKAELRKLPRFTGCLFGIVEGRSAANDLLDAGVCDDSCTFEDFVVGTDTTSAILDRRSLTLSVRVLLTILQKTYKQVGWGRKEAALFRGLDPQARELVPNILQLARRHGLLARSGRSQQIVWLPVRAARVRAIRILALPIRATDPVIGEVEQL